MKRPAPPILQRASLGKVDHTAKPAYTRDATHSARSAVDQALDITTTAVGSAATA